MADANTELRKRELMRDINAERQRQAEALDAIEQAKNDLMQNDGKIGIIQLLVFLAKSLGAVIVFVVILQILKALQVSINVIASDILLLLVFALPTWWQIRNVKLMPATLQAKCEYYENEYNQSSETLAQIEKELQALS